MPFYLQEELVIFSGQHIFFLGRVHPVKFKFDYVVQIRHQRGLDIRGQSRWELTQKFFGQYLKHIH